MLQAKTKYHGPTDRNAARISVTLHTGKRTYIPYPHDLPEPKAHAAAAEKVIREFIAQSDGHESFYKRARFIQIPILDSQGYETGYTFAPEREPVFAI